MNLPKMILVPTDFGESAANALEYALSLASKVDARVLVLNAVQVPVLGVIELGVVVTDGALDSSVRASQAELDRIASRTTSTAVETMVRTGDARDVILEVAKGIHADLIVMGTHGRRGIRRLLLGSVAEEIVRTASCPVLTVHALAHAAA